MTDILERLNNFCIGTSIDALIVEAAAEIRRLRMLPAPPDDVERALEADTSRSWLTEDKNKRCHVVTVRNTIERCALGALGCCLKHVYRHAWTGKPPEEGEVLPCAENCRKDNMGRELIFNKDRWYLERRR